MIGSSRAARFGDFVGDLNPQNRGGGDPALPGPNAVWIGRARRLMLRPLFGALCEVFVIIRDLKRHLFGYFVLHIIGKIARLVGAFAPVLGVVNKGGRDKAPLTRPPQVARTSPPRFHPINQTDHSYKESSLTGIVGSRILYASRPAAGERRAGTCASTVERGHPHGPAITLSHSRSGLG